MKPHHSILAITSLAVLLLTVCNAPAQSNAKKWKQLDQNNDGKLSKAEFPEQYQARFTQIDADHDGFVTQAEFEAFRRKGNSSETKKDPRKKPTGTIAPTHADVSYGDHKKQAFDIWLAESNDGKPTPLVIYIHGGGFRGGDKTGVSGTLLRNYLDQGISFASMNYRLSDVGPYPIMMHDAARGLQTIRSKASHWNLDPERIACYGGSAGAGISLWLAFHDDLADRTSDDPIARQSTRIVAAGTQNGQSSYDLQTFRDWFGVANLKIHPALMSFYGAKDENDLESDRVKKLMIDASAITHLTKDDPPVFMTYSRGDVPVNEKTNAGVVVHHARLGIKLKKAMAKLGLECVVTWPGNPSAEYKDIHAFLQNKVQPKKSDKPK